MRVSGGRLAAAARQVKEGKGTGELDRLVRNLREGRGVEQEESGKKSERNDLNEEEGKPLMGRFLDELGNLLPRSANGKKAARRCNQPNSA
jgi:hypothetical protein